MSTFDDEKYLLDGEPMSANGLIELAKEYSEEYRNTFWRSTSQASCILRDNGHTVGNNPDWITSDE